MKKSKENKKMNKKGIITIIAILVILLVIGVVTGVNITVKKDYIPTYNVASTQQTEDYLWLLSCGEIWDNGADGGESRGAAITTEGKQYKYYKMNLGSTRYSAENSITIKRASNGNAGIWWLRSPDSGWDDTFNEINNDGSWGPYNSKATCGVAPGFAI